MSVYVYIIYSSIFDKYYIGQTHDVTERLRRHNTGLENATRPYKPWSLLLSIRKESRSEAMVLEKKLKNLSRARIQIFINKYGGPNAGADDAA
jgi:putative endonuclease